MASGVVTGRSSVPIGVIMAEMEERDMVSGSWKCLGSIALVLLALSLSACGRRADQSSGDGGNSGLVDSAPDAPIPPDSPIRPDAPLSSDAQIPLDALGRQAPRLLAPLSMTAVTQQRPTLRWTLPGGFTAPVVDLCRDRACATPLPITVQIANDGLSAVPQAALPTGWVYWRVRVTSGSDTMSSTTWQFWVGWSSASNPVDTGNGALLDVNGDGYADFVVGAPLSLQGFGAVYLYLGSATASATDWNGASPAARIELFGGGAGQFGSVVASAGDINGDGYADFLVGAVGGGATGPARLYLGSASPSAVDWNGSGATRRIDLAGPVPGSPGFGLSVAGAGDVDGDGYADFVIAGGGGGSGGAHVYFGSAAPSEADWDAGASPRRIDLANPGLGDGYGGAVAGAGDVNGDGYADILIGTRSTYINSDDGKAYLYLGSAMPSVTSWNKRSSTTRIELATPDGFNRGFGASVAGAGDVNGDGYADFVIGTELADDGTSVSATGAAHLYLGSAMPSAADWSGAAAAKRVDLVSPDGVGGQFGSAVAGAGDVNGDGFADFVVTAFQTGQSRGAAHVYLGRATPGAAGWNGAPHSSRIDLLNPDGVRARFGGSAGGAGDVNGDGFADFLVGTFSDAFLSTTTGGAAHLYLGLAIPASVSWNGTAPTRRIEMLNPGGPIAAFGNAVALADTRATLAMKRRLK
jgi:hypothetical protein